MNLILAMIWLVLGVGLLAVAWLDPEAPGAWEYRELPGYVALAMFAYNMIRWWVTRGRYRGESSAYTLLQRPRAEPREPADTSFRLVDEPLPVRLPPSTDIQPVDPSGPKP